MRVEFLPPYSPDFNPIELAFSAIKYRIRRNGGNLRELMADKINKSDVMVQLWNMVMQTSLEDARGWYHHCGYL